VLDPTIYRTRGDHANHYATDAVAVISSIVTPINGSKNNTLLLLSLKFMVTKRISKWSLIFMYSAPSVYRPPFYRQPRLSPKFSSVPISPIKNTSLYCQTQLPPQVFRHKNRKTNINSSVSTPTTTFWQLCILIGNYGMSKLVIGHGHWSHSWGSEQVISCFD
jgi:hypothetical protein